MTISSENNRADYDLTAGTVTEFPTGFYFLDETHVAVYHVDAAGVETLLVLGTDYTVAGVGDPAGGKVVFATAPTGKKLTLLRNVPFTQLTDYVENDKFPADSHERALDKLTMEMQQISEEVTRCIIASPSSTNPPNWSDLEQAKNIAVAAAAAAVVSKNKAHQWAEEAEDVPVDPGEFSSHHWANKSREVVKTLQGRNLLINGDMRVDQRGKHGAGAVGEFAFDRWKITTATDMTQIVEEGSFKPSTVYTLSGDGVTTQQVTSPASGHWTIPNVPLTARNVQLEHGSVATEFERLPISLTEMLCYRYYWEPANPSIFFYTIKDTHTAAKLSILYRAKMRIAPTVQFTLASGTNESVQESTSDGCTIAATATASGYALLKSIKADAELS